MSSSSSPLSHADADHPPVINYILSFILVGLAWGLTTPFIRRAARTHKPRARPSSQASASGGDRDRDRDGNASAAARPSWLQSKLRGAFFAVVDLLRNPRYAVPLLLNLTGSVWFFLLIGKAELSLTVPIVNATAFLFTVLGEWLAEGKMISQDTGIGMILSVTGIALCVLSKS